jgi:glycogen debranching enzyme
MTEGWAYGGAPQQAGAAGGTITLIEGVTFCICGRSGDIRPGTEQGLFYRDTRYLNRFELTVDGQHLDPLVAHRTSPYSGTFVSRRQPRPGVADSTLLVVRKRFVGNGIREDITLRNLGREAAVAEVSLQCGADFGGLFEVKEGRARPREGVEHESTADGVRISYAVGNESREVLVEGTPTPGIVHDRLVWQVVIPPRSETTVSALVVPAVDGVAAVPRYLPGQPVESSEPATKLAQWRQTAPDVTTPHTGLAHLLATSAEDLGLLRIFDPSHPDRVVVAAGAPWFMTLFGRDSLLTSWMLLPLDPSVARGTLKTLAQLQGSKVDLLSEEEPGRILHEVRSGLDAGAALGGGNVYYGSIDATPLFVMLLGELRRWGLAREDVEELLPHADRALDWILRYGDRDGDGYVEYQRATERGLLNQGWKDSFDAISFVGGAFAEPPIALAEVQGYTYAAYLARVHFAREVGDEETARTWSERAETLKRRFNEDFWLPDRGWYAMALDGQKRPVDALGSNIGHCLWTGIVDEDKAAAVAKHLMSPAMFTGFGVRTLSSEMANYNPVSYHNGSVWPHDNAIIAGGLMRYGFVEEAQRIALGLLDAAGHLHGRLPALFSGFDREEFPSPEPYTTSCEPQAWAAATPLYLLRTLLRFDPWIPFGRVWCDPAVPDRLLPLAIQGVHLAGASVGVEVTDSGWEVEGLPPGVELMERPRSPLTAE